MINSLLDKIKIFLNKFLVTEKRSTSKRYGVPLLIIAIILSTNFILHARFTDIRSFHLLTLAVILSAWYGGFGPGMLATITISLLDYFYILRNLPLLDFDRFFSTLLLFIVGFIISIITESLRQANKQKDDFLGFASHELKNPLSVIKAYATLIQTKASKINKKDFAALAQKIDQQATTATMMINDLLDVTKIRSGDVPLRYETFDLDALIKEIIENQKKVNHTHSIIYIKKGKKTANVYGDKNRIEQVVTNLITNAMKYSPGARKIKVILNNYPSGISVDVRDYGIGISPEAQEKIFQPFYRTERAKTSSQGLGLGLHIASRIIKRHQGKLSVESIPGKGSTFSILLKQAKQ